MAISLTQPAVRGYFTDKRLAALTQLTVRGSVAILLTQLAVCGYFTDTCLAVLTQLTVSGYFTDAVNSPWLFH